MIPKEHGAWNALLVCLFAGWMALGGWNLAAVAASIFWFSGFILRAPLVTAKQYRVADPQRSRRALGLSFVLLGLLSLSGFVFYQTAPPKAVLAVLSGALPIGFLLYIFVFIKRTFRLFAIEVVGFSGISLLAPIIYLTRNEATWDKALLLYSLFGGYFILALIYIKKRLEWKRLDETNGKISHIERFYDLRGIFLFWIIFVLSVLRCSGMNVWLLAGPIYSGGRIIGGTLWGKKDIPTMKLGIREMIHSLIFMVIAFFTWNLT